MITTDPKNKIIEDFLNKETDIASFVEEMAQSDFLDKMIYGGNPWNYLEETKLNFYYQGKNDEDLKCAE